MGLLSLSISAKTFNKKSGSSLFGAYMLTRVNCNSFKIAFNIINLPSGSLKMEITWTETVFLNKIATPLLDELKLEK